MKDQLKKLKLGLVALAVVTALGGCTLDGDDGQDGATGAQGIAGTDGTDGTNGVDGQSLPRELAIEVVGRFSAGGVEIYGKSAAEIVQFHATSQSAFAINAALNQVEVISLSNIPTAAVGNPIIDTSLTSQAFTFPSSVSVKDADGIDQTVALGVANSIAINGDLLALAVEGETKTDNGAVLFYSLDALGQGTFLKAVLTGALPDMVTFSEDGSLALIANEGEPDSDYDVDPEGSISVVSITDMVPADLAQTINLTTDMVFSNDTLDDEDYDTDEERRALLASTGVKFAGPDGTSVAQDLEPEYIAMSADGKKAYVSLQEANAIGIIDLDDMTIEVKGLGFKDWGTYELDFTNKDEIPSFSNVPGLFGMYQPDTIATYQWNGATFILSANEGDSKDWDAYSEEVRVEDIIDPDELNMQLSDELQAIYDVSGADDGLGRLKVTTALGDADQDGVYEALYAYGSRSFSIWDQSINQVFDSGDDFEKISAAILGNDFNSAHTENKGDNRSDDKGGEPEAIAVGEINGRTYAFIGLERSGDLFTYDVTNPFNVAFVAHNNNRNFDTDFELDDDLENPCDENEGMDCAEVADSGDLGPESIKFVSAGQSPNGNALLIIGNEVSGTVTIYQVTEIE
ncbi:MULTISPECIES: choice-of-anchor I family protein [Aliiglaciecola]|uniref:choice-of-anchor I family protein n=1 Tax=Aliiglaciecola TaxID=1406885 RepID=UPI001C091EBC|nr:MULTISPECIES: choice-of-anchor I family protein [Aliiglaciecola]MBU2877877.1 choice-of-anchor I family protein [Aliiglaciecola lipolytica]MDO6709240.1 choice-of-anchor I family protein [Aliiglaciecola sp. 2_MG-2023]MDO6750388.1 choice-of-anchor I family protein [Aliiglaciecola sp. 1_MG-2023]